jgi:hypothetical protein
VLLPPSQGLRSIFFSESQTMSSLTKFLSEIINIQNKKLILLDIQWNIFSCGIYKISYLLIDSSKSLVKLDIVWVSEKKKGFKPCDGGSIAVYKSNKKRVWEITNHKTGVTIPYSNVAAATPLLKSQTGHPFPPLPDWDRSYFSNLRAIATGLLTCATPNCRCTGA